LDRLLVLLVSGVVILAAIFTLRPILLRLSQRDALRKASQPLPRQWVALLHQSIPATRHLTDEQRVQLLRSSRDLIRTRRWEGSGGLILTEVIQLTIAAQACLLTLAMPGEPFPGVREILVYPRTFVPRHVCDPRKWLQASEPQRPLPLEGEAWGNGVMVLSWEAVREGARNPGDGSNVVLHEFAHELDYERHLTAGLELAEFVDGAAATMVPSVPDPEEWRRVIQASYERLSERIAAHTASALNEYGGTNIAEFFAVATETFFEKPVQLAREDPDLYAQLRSLYQQDPAAVA